MDLDEIAGVGGQQEQRENYKAALDAAVASGDAAACKRFVDHGGRYRVTGWCDRKERGCPGLLATAAAAAAHPCRRSPAASPPACPAVLSDAVPLVLSRTLLMAFAQSLQQLAPDVQQAVAT